MAKTRPKPPAAISRPPPRPARKMPAAQYIAEQLAELEAAVAAQPDDDDDDGSGSEELEYDSDDLAEHHKTTGSKCCIHAWYRYALTYIARIKIDDMPKSWAKKLGLTVQQMKGQVFVINSLPKYRGMYTHCYITKKSY